MVKNRNLHLDLMRTLAIVLMVIFHFSYDLKYFGWTNWNIPDGDNWKYFRYIILTLFFLCIGAGLVYSHAKKFNRNAFLKRLAKVFAGAVITTSMSLVMFPQQWIYFGVLQFIVVASILSIAFVPFPKVSLVTGIAIILAAYFGFISKRWPFSFFDEYLPQYTTDFVALFPWLGVILLGMVLAHSQWFNRQYLPHNTLTEKLAVPGKHSLIIYLIHQPIMFALLAPIHWLMN